MKVAETRVSPRFQTVVPAAIRTALGVEAGDSLEWHSDICYLPIFKEDEQGILVPTGEYRAIESVVVKKKESK